MKSFITSAFCAAALLAAPAIVGPNSGLVADAQAQKYDKKYSKKKAPVTKKRVTNLKRWDPKTFLDSKTSKKK